MRCSGAIDGDREPAGGGLWKSHNLAQVRTLLHHCLFVQSTACTVRVMTPVVSIGSSLI